MYSNSITFRQPIWFFSLKCVSSKMELLIAHCTYSTVLTCQYKFIAIIAWLLVLFLYLPLFCSLFLNEFYEKFEHQFNQFVLQSEKSQSQAINGRQTHSHWFIIDWCSDIGFIGILNFWEKSIFRHWQKRTSVARHMQHAYG